MSEGININISAGNPAEVREMFEKCMAEVNQLHYDGKLVLKPGAAQVYVFGDDCTDCTWRNRENCATCKGLGQAPPSWVKDQGMNVLWGVYKNTDMTEGRGMRYLERLFATEAAAVEWRNTQSDYPGWPYHRILPVQIDLLSLFKPEGLVLPR